MSVNKQQVKELTYSVTLTDGIIIIPQFKFSNKLEAISFAMSLVGLKDKLIDGIYVSVLENGIPILDL